ncbi:MAG: hypothetical protein A2077_04895 [Nitrospirae bacterium GWC2_46_6]|nr:MAG: hypothetical protein A2077_04895 [Nitrospirae bacterium GWC2_46_6]OGW24235.1 MAG: hypothetical protein A2X55_04730 [Nitrospirae bacterium GWB2_47_37]HAK89653.1 hypothetical protein [Nitrospiraceae bacterium]
MEDSVNQWESNIYSKGKQLNRYTWGEVYYYANRYFFPQISRNEDINVLELGSGTGNNLIFFAELGMNVYGIEGSSTACAHAQNKIAKYPNIKSKIICGNFCSHPLPFENNSLDLILDRGALTHNFSKEIKNVLTEAYRVLKPGGLFFSIHFFSDKDSRFGKGIEVDYNTFKDTGGKTFEGVPQVHFSNLEEIYELYDGFTFELIEEKSVKRYRPYEGEDSASFDIVAMKPYE